MQFEKRPSGLVIPAPIGVGGVFKGQIIRGGEVVDEWEEHNIVVNEGLDHLLATEFCAGPQISQWYIGLFKGNYVPVNSDKAATISQNATEATEYTSTTRILYGAAESNQSVTNSNAPATFTFNAPVTIYGGFLISSNGKNSQSGTLFSATAFSTPKQLGQTDQLLLTYLLSASSA